MTVDARDLILAIEADSHDTAERWARLTAVPPDCFDETFLFHCYSHHVGCIAYDALIELGWDSLLPPFLFTVLSRLAGLSEAVWDRHYAGLVELSAADPDLVRRSLIVKGALLGLDYRSKRHRVMGDFDLIATSEDLEPLVELLTKLGYERRSLMAYDMIKDVGPAYTGAGAVAMHVWEMPAGWERHVTDGFVADLPFRVPTPELHLIELLMNAHEHAASWHYALWESDLQLVRALDVELINAKSGGVDPLRLWATAVEVGLPGEVGLGLWVHEQLRGGLPAGWEVLRPVIEAVGPYGDMFAMPRSVDSDTLVRRWPLPVRERAFHPSRHRLAIEQLPPHQRGAEFIAAMKAGRISREEPVADIAGQARAALSGVSLPATG
jgi:hypothetical protein